MIVREGEGIMLTTSGVKQEVRDIIMKSSVPKVCCCAVFFIIAFLPFKLGVGDVISLSF